MRILECFKDRKSWLWFFFLLVTWQTGAQIKGDSYQKWYSWNASAGFIMPVNPFSASLGGGIPHRYQFSGAPGYAFSVSKQVGLQFITGVELQDLRLEGMMENFGPEPGKPAYNFRMRTYSITGEYFFSPSADLNPFILLKAGYGGINRALPKVDLSRTKPADRWDFFFTGGGGVTFHGYPNFSFNLTGEFTPVPNTYLYELFDTLPRRERKLLPMVRILLTVTAHTDIRVFYPQLKDPSRPTKKNKTKGNEGSVPFYRKRK